MNLWIVIPAYNEQSRLSVVVKKIAKYSNLNHLIVVDDGSDRPITNKKIKVLRHSVNLGKGSAMKTGADFAFKNGATHVLFMDADGQHDPHQIPKFKRLLNQGFDIVFGSRQPKIDAPLVRILGNKIDSIYVNIFFGVYVSDILSGYRALSKKAYLLLAWESKRYGVETEMVCRLGKFKNKIVFTEFPIESVYIDKYKGVTIIDALEIVVQTLWWKLSWGFK